MRKEKKKLCRNEKGLTSEGFFGGYLRNNKCFVEGLTISTSIYIVQQITLDLKVGFKNSQFQELLVQ